MLFGLVQEKMCIVPKKKLSSVDATTWKRFKERENIRIQKMLGVKSEVYYFQCSAD